MYDVVSGAVSGQALDLVDTTAHAGMYLHERHREPRRDQRRHREPTQAASIPTADRPTPRAGGSTDWYGNTPYGFRPGTLPAAIVAAVGWFNFNQYY